jgi:hypothetical protein
MNIVTAIFEELDRDHSGYVVLHEFIDGFFINIVQTQERIEELGKNIEKDLAKRKQIAEKLKDAMDEQIN